jgi:hypothetical protein
MQKRHRPYTIPRLTRTTNMSNMFEHVQASGFVIVMVVHAGVSTYKYQCHLGRQHKNEIDWL